MIYEIIPILVEKYPEIVPYLKGRAREIAKRWKTYDELQFRITRLVSDAYNGVIGTVDFVNGVISAVSAQLREAYNAAWYDMDLGGGTSAALPDYLEASLYKMIGAVSNSQYAYQFFTEIMKARQTNQPVDSLYSRADLWSNRWNEAYNEAIRLIRQDTGGNLVWRIGATEKHCVTCQSLNGLVATAKEWDESGYRPQSAPNDMLECGGWRCDCSLEPTEQRRSRNARQRLGI